MANWRTEKKAQDPAGYEKYLRREVERAREKRRVRKEKGGPEYEEYLKRHRENGKAYYLRNPNARKKEYEALKRNPERYAKQREICKQWSKEKRFCKGVSKEAILSTGITEEQLGQTECLKKILNIERTYSINTIAKAIEEMSNLIQDEESIFKNKEFLEEYIFTYNNISPKR